VAIDMKKAKPTRYPGVFRLPDGRLLARAVVRLFDGKVRVLRKVLPIGSSEVDAVNAVAALKEDLKNPQPPPTDLPLRLDTNLTVEQYVVSWLQVRAPRLSPSTAATYGWCINDRILPRLGWLACKDVTRMAVEAWVVWAESLVQPPTRKMTRNGKTTTYANPDAGKPYRQDTMRQWWRCLSTILGDMAVDLQLPNPTARVLQPERPELALMREQRTVDAEATGKLLDEVRRRFPLWFAEIAVMTMTGMRAGEVYGLKWECVDFAKANIVVRRAVSKGTLRERTKTKAWRNVPLHPVLAAILLEHRQRQLANQDPALDLGLVFPNRHGKLRSPSSTKKLWPQLAEAIGIDMRLGQQVLRRSLNTALVHAGVDRITTRAIMGHTSEQMTERYAGIGAKEKADAVDKVQPRLSLVLPQPEQQQ
jgi:integrase